MFRRRGLRGFAARTACLVVAMVVSTATSVRGAADGLEEGLDSREVITSGPIVEQVKSLLKLKEASLVSLAVDTTPGQHLQLSVPTPEGEITLELWPVSVRAENYQVLAQLADGSYVEVEPSPVRTLRGWVVGSDGSRVAASTTDAGLMADISFADGRRLMIEPLAERLEDARLVDHAVFKAEAVDRGTTSCANDPIGEFTVPGNDGLEKFADGGRTNQDASLRGGTLFCTELACDADVEYFNILGSIANVETQINSVTNGVNTQYERDVDITYVITTIIVRTANPDPYASFDSDGLLCEFITEWTNNQAAIQRDVAKLFTGRTIQTPAVGIIGQAATFADICDNAGFCTAPGTLDDGAYCYSQNQFNGNFGCATDLMAHELGHVWGAFHCSCPSNTMNPSITCSNVFSAASISSIVSHRDSRTCLDTGGCVGSTCGNSIVEPGESCDPPDGVTCDANCQTILTNDSCADAAVLTSPSTTNFDNGPATPTQNDGGPGDPELPPGSPSCQWNSVPSDAHNTVWFSFTATDTSVELETCTTFSIQDTIIALYSGNCGSLTELACGEDDCGTPDAWRSRICYQGLTPGDEYLVMVGNPGSWASSLPGEIILDLACPCPTFGTEVGACCLGGGGCGDNMTEGQCAGAGGSHKGIGTDCGGVSCSSPCVAAGVRSCADHGGAGRLCLDLTANSIEPRSGGITSIEVDVDNATSASSATIACVDSGDQSGLVSGVSVIGNTVTVDLFASLPGGDACTITLDCGASVCVRGLAGDIDRNGVVSTGDASIIKPHFGRTAVDAGPEFDFDRNDVISTGDASTVKPLFGNSAAACP